MKNVLVSYVCFKATQHKQSLAIWQQFFSIYRWCCKPTPSPTAHLGWEPDGQCWPMSYLQSSDILQVCEANMVGPLYFGPHDQLEANLEPSWANLELSWARQYDTSLGIMGFHSTLLWNRPVFLFLKGSHMCVCMYIQNSVCRCMYVYIYVCLHECMWLTLGLELGL